MIRSLRHKGLKRLFRDDDGSKVQPAHIERLKDILARLDAAAKPQDMNLPGLRLHPLKGNRKGTWAVSVDGNTRVTFDFDGEDVVDVDYEDYH